MAEPSPRHSIRRRLLAGLLGTISVAWLVTLFFSYRDTRHELYELLDAHLAQSASLLLTQVSHDGDEIDTEHTPMLHRYNRKVAFQIWEQGTELRLHSVSAPNEPLSGIKEGFSNSTIGSDKWRVFSTWDDGHRYLIQIGERQEARDELSQAIANNLLQPLLITLPILGVLIWFGVSRGLRPLTSLSNQVASRDPDNLSPLESSDAPLEVSPLVDGLNQLFARLHSSLENERRFTADAAHELRTPLAAIKTQAQVAQGAVQDEDRKRALENVISGCDRAARLVDQLLTLARLEPAQFKHRDSCELHKLALTVVAELAPAAIEKGIDIQLAEGGSYDIPCEPELIKILMRNLIDNAIRYSPRDGVVQVAIEKSPDSMVLKVRDQGPGIPEAEKELVWERFYRVLGTGETGSGLGLSIVRRIAELHQATVSFQDVESGKGLEVMVKLPGHILETRSPKG
jgi:two-component system sensor histidine kinase QseC